ncbi:MBOAT family O-acyltransferase [Gorillibacterium sp. CAU 1737]|uniref:MBOAT family O-acyltransferase n=1 Tax=Gorillibacterium sp. CAU 1737 TaxID=3140362 RepID=UPI0032605550
MVFSSLLFLFLFLPAVLICNFLSPWRIKNAVLLFFSLLFYAWGEPVYIVIMLLSTVTDFSFGLLLEKAGLSDRRRKAIVALSIIVNLALLSYFKYADFLIENLNAWLGTEVPLRELPLPIGISFYTFQSISYIIDVYRGTSKAQRNWLDFATFVALFPQLVAGPIVQYSSVAEQLRHRKVDSAMFAQGIRRFIKGLAKKVLLANNSGLLWHAVSGMDTGALLALTAWLGILAFAFQIYFDFSGYSDMAIGLGLMLGFRFNENFNRPYSAQSMTDFWRRWHISLGTWFRDYLYIPLGGNRRGRSIQVRNILIVWTLTGIWHGASWNFLIWGVYFGVILIFEKWVGLRLLARLPRPLRHGYALLLILIGWVFFAFDDLSAMGTFFLALSARNGLPLADTETGYLLYTNLILLVVLVLTIVVEKSRNPRTERPYLMLLYHGVLFLFSIAYLVDATFNPFLYFRF